MAVFDFAEVSWLGVGAAVLFSMVFGYLWYAPFLFGKAWLRMVGLSEEKAKSGMAMGLAGGITGAILTATGMGLVIQALPGNADWMDGLQVGLLFGAFFGLPFAIIDVAFLQKPRGLLLINGAHHLIELSTMGLLIGLIGAL